MFELNENQSRAVQSTEGFVRVIAGAGSGKTGTIAARYAWLVNELGIMPSSILCISFTNKSAAEMRKRIQKETGPLPQSQICTFHSFCARVLREDGFRLALPRSFTLLDGADQDALLQQVYERNGYTLAQMPFNKAKDMIAMRKYGPDPGYRFDLLAMSIQDLSAKEAAAQNTADRIFYGMLVEQKKCWGLDYDDLVILTVHLLDTDQEAAGIWQNRLEYIMVDEFQDVDSMQSRLLDILGRGHGNVMVVGDPDQTIYTWRGARVEHLLEFDDRHPGTETIILNENYRSSAPILQCANTLISRNRSRIKKDLFTTVKTEGVPVKAGWYPDVRKEAEAAAKQAGRWLEEGTAPGQIAILVRAHFVTRSLEEQLEKEKIPYELNSGVPFYQRAEIKDALAWCRMAVSRDDLDFRRTVNNPVRNIGKTRMKFLEELAQKEGISLFEALEMSAETELFANTGAREYLDLISGFSWENKPVSTCLEQLLDQSGMMVMLRTKGAQERLDNIAELKQAAAEYEIEQGEETNLLTWLSHTALSGSGDRPDTGRKIRLMTIHTAKGLEFEKVWIAGMNEAILPSAKAATVQALEEERRLAFVALTRAKDELILSAASGNLHSTGARVPSRFLSDLECESLVWQPPCPKQLLQKTAQRVQASPEIDENLILEPGCRILHKVFGPGTVEKTDPVRKCYEIRFEKLNTTRTLSMSAKLERIS